MTLKVEDEQTRWIELVTQALREGNTDCEAIATANKVIDAYRERYGVEVTHKGKITIKGGAE